MSGSVASVPVHVSGHDITVVGDRNTFASCEGTYSYILATHESSVDITSIISDDAADRALDLARAKYLSMGRGT